MKIGQFLHADEIPSCVHDGDSRFEQRERDGVGVRETKQWCCQCDALLSIVYHDVIGGALWTEYHDEVYELLYTKAGRARIVRVALEEMGMPEPCFWRRKP